jgi:hypothetical protein
LPPVLPDREIRSKVFPHVQARLQARPIYHHKRDPIEAHLTIVFAALAVSRWVEAQTRWSIRRLVRTARRYKTIEIQVGVHTISAAASASEDLQRPRPRPPDPGTPH